VLPEYREVVQGL